MGARGLDQGGQGVGVFQQNAASRFLGDGFAELRQKSGVTHQWAYLAVADRFGRKLDGRAGFNIAIGRDMVADARRRGAQRIAIVIPVGIDQHDGFLAPHLHEESAKADDLLCGQRQLSVGALACGAIDVVPGVEDVAVDEFVEVFLGEQVVDIGLAEACGDAGD